MSPSGKAPDFDSGIRRFKSGHPSQQKRHPCGCLFCWLGCAPVRTEPRMRRRCTFAVRRSGSLLTRRRACESRSEAELPANLFISNIHRTRRAANTSLFCWLGWAPVRTEPRMRRRCTFAARRSGSTLTRRRACESRSEAELPAMSPHNTKTVDRSEPPQCRGRPPGRPE